MPDQNDAVLVEAARAGDNEAFAELERRYREAAFGIAFHKLGDFEAARDAAQEALVRAYLDLHKLREPARFPHWLYRITGMVAADVFRRRRPTWSLDDPTAPQQISPHVTPAEAAERSEKARRVREALAVLGETDRLTVILHYVNGYSHEEIGQILDTSVSAVKSRIHRARRRLKQEMQDMISKGLRESVLEQLHLPKLEFSVDWDRFDSSYRSFLELRITEVFGSSPVVREGDNYLVCGEYRLLPHEPVKKPEELDPWLVERFGEEVAPQVVVLYAAAGHGVSTGYHCFLTPGSGTFEDYAHAGERKPGGESELVLMVDRDDNRVVITLKG